MSNVREKYWTESLVFSKLRHVFADKAHIILPQVSNGTGYARKQPRTADALVVSCWPSRGLWFAGVEIKVSVSDWKKELASPEKAEEVMKYCKYWYVASPEKIIDPATVPDRWGLIHVWGNTAKIVKAAPPLEYKPPDMLLVCAILRAAYQSMVPRGDIQDQIRQAREDGAKGAKIPAQYEFEALKETVENFERESGIVLQGHRWDAGRIGEAVRFVLDGHLMQSHKVANDMIRLAEATADGWRKAMSAFATAQKTQENTDAHSE